MCSAPLSAQTTPAEIRDHVFVTVQRGTSSAAGDALQQAALRQETDPALARLLRARQDLVEQVDAAKRALTQQVGTTGAAADARATDLRATLADLARDATNLDAQIEGSFPAFKDLTNPRPMQVAEVQATLRPGEVLIRTLTSETDVFVWAISPTRADWTRARFEPGALDGMVRSLRRALDVTTNDRGAAALDDDAPVGISGRSFDRFMAHQLYLQLFAPLEDVLDGADHMLAVLDGPLSSLPLAVLVGHAPTGADDDPSALRDTDWLIRRHAITVLPSVTTLRALRRPRAPVDETRRRPFVGFGDPIFDTTAAPGITGQVAQDDYVSRGVFDQIKGVQGLAPLPGTARELRALAQLTQAPPDALFLQAAATENAVRQADLEDVDILAFATHGLLAGEISGLGEPALVFTPPGTPGPQDDALLTASEAAQLSLSARLIILSACNTAASDGTPGAEGLSGLARAFIYAGARSILVSHWPVDDRATEALTTGMVARLQSGTPRSASLRQSILTLMDTPDRPDYAHPRFWAPFILVGEGSDRD